MLGENDRAAIAQGMRTLWIIWGAMMGSLVLYVFICYQWGDELRQAGSPAAVPVGTMRTLFFGITVFILAAARLIRKFMLARRPEAPAVMTSTAPGSGNPSLFLATYSTAVIVSLALSESIGIFGLVLFVLGDSLQVFRLFVAISVAALYFFRPRREELGAYAAALIDGGDVTPEV